MDATQVRIICSQVNELLERCRPLKVALSDVIDELSDVLSHADPTDANVKIAEQALVQFTRSYAYLTKCLQTQPLAESMAEFHAAEPLDLFPASTTPKLKEACCG